MIAIDLPHARALALQVVLGQAVVTVIAALLGWSIAGGRAAQSALLGGGIGTVASLVMVVLTFGGEGSSPLRLMRAFIVAEAVKFAVMVGLFVAVLRLIKVSPAAMLCAYAATFLVYWAAIARGGLARAAAR
jgi:F0F1-type ATP synthase assembly protein I